MIEYWIIGLLIWIVVGCIVAYKIQDDLKETNDALLVWLWPVYLMVWLVLKGGK